MTPQKFERAEILISQHRYSDAAEIISEIISTEPDNFVAIAMLAEVHLMLNKTDSALELINSAIGLNPDIASFFYVKSRILSELDKYDDAEQLIDQAIDLDPENADYFAYKASIKLTRKKYKEALRLSDIALNIEAENILALNIRSSALTKLNKKKEAKITIEGALREDPGNAYTHANYGWNLLHEGNHKQALVHFKESLKNDPELDFARSGMIEALKARFIFYKLYLSFVLWMSKLPARAQWIVLIVFYLGSRSLHRLADKFDALSPYINVLLIALGFFAFSTWIIGPLTNVLLRLNPYGKYLLDKNETRTSFLVGISFLIFLISIVFYFFLETQFVLVLAFWGLTMMLPLGRFFTNSNKKNMYQIYCIFLGIIGLCAISITFVSNEMFNLFTVIYLFGFIAYQWIANYFSIKESNV